MDQHPLPIEKTVADADNQKQRSTLVSRNVTIEGHRTSVRLEPDMWSGLNDICRRERSNLHAICTAVAQYKDANTSLTAAIRVFVMAYYRAAATEDGHTRAGHGSGFAITTAGLSPAGMRVQNIVQPQISPAPASLTNPGPVGMPHGQNGTPSYAANTTRNIFR